MKTLIYQYYQSAEFTNLINDADKYYTYSHNSVSVYSKKINTEYRLFTQGHEVHPMYGVFYPIQSRLAENYDAICFIDSDILVTTQSDNIFEYMSNNTISMHRCLNNKFNYYNSGVVIIPKSVYKALLEYISNLEDHFESKKVKPTFGGYDQKILNEFANKHGCNNLPAKFNWIVPLVKDYPTKQKFQQSFIHYLRKSKSQVIKDYKNNIILKEQQ